jgi:transmembrane sensor
VTIEPKRLEDGLRAEATRWFSAQRSGDMAAEEREAFADWLRSNPGAHAQLERLQQQWDALDSIANDPAVLEIREHDVHAYNRPARFKALLALAAAVLLLVSSSVTFLQYGNPVRSWFGSEGELFRTGTGQRTTATLTDGSVVTLDAESELRVVEMGARRRLRLIRGHAFFQVAKDRVHPFLVEAASKTIRAVGTEFDVQLDDQAKLTVTLIEGKVRVEQPNGWVRPGRRVNMVAGARLIAKSDHAWNVTHVDTASETSWLTGRLTFIREPLAEALNEVNRYSARKIVFVDGPAPATNIVGVFAAGDVDSFVTALELNGIARVSDRTDTKIMVTRSARDGRGD